MTDVAIRVENLSKRYRRLRFNVLTFQRDNVMTDIAIRVENLSKRCRRLRSPFNVAAF